MLSTHDMLDYMRARRVGNTDEIAADANDPVLSQAACDGYADRVGDRWIGRGSIQPGERRIVRFSDGGTKEIKGSA